MDGWRYNPLRPFRCSCGETVVECPFFRYMRQFFEDRGLQFDPRNFETGYRIAGGGRVNRMLVARLPRPFAVSAVEHLRDRFVWSVPQFRRHLRELDRRNQTFIEGALSYSGARVFVDACKGAYRLRHLRRIPGIELAVVHLVRDLRGVVLSNLEMHKPGWDARVATRMWIGDQCVIHRILGEFATKLQVFYEDLCNDVNGEIRRIHELGGVVPRPYPGSLKAREHHILGNSMRLSQVTDIKNSERWRERLSSKDLACVQAEAARFVRAKPRHAVSALIGRYLD
jgi:hypothetical protein